MSSHRRTLAAGLATAAASVSLYPIFTGGLWFLVGLGSIAVVAAAGTATRVRRLPEPVCLLGGLVALLLFLNLAFSNARSLLHLLPTPASMGELFDLAGQGFNEASKYAPPVPELRGMLLLAAGGIGITALLTDWIAVRLGSAALAGLPLLLLFVEPFTLSVGRGFLGTTVAFGVGVAGYLALLSSEGKDQIREWEHQNPSARDAPDTRPLAAAGRRVGFASVVLALFLPLVIPGLHVTRLFGGQPGIGGRPGSGSGGGPAGVGFPGVDTLPTQQLAQELNGRPADVLVYDSTQASPDYLQIYVLDQLTDSGWRLFSQPEVPVHVHQAMPAPPGLTNRLFASEVSTSIRIADDVGADDLGALPVPYPAVSVRANKGNLVADRSTLMLFDAGTALGGLQYSVTSLVDSPPELALNDAPPPPADIVNYYQKVPASYDSLRSLAESIVAKAGATTAFEKAVALQNWLADGTFKYTLKAPAVLDASDLANFLERTKSGYCQQFSFAMAVLARLLGIPSRVAYGFTSGTPTGNSDQWVVTTHDAHAWPELYFEGQGWLRFEPTPAGAEGQGTAYTPSYAYLPGSTTGAGAAHPEPTSAPTSAGGKGSLSNLSPNLRNALDGGNLGNDTGATPGTVAQAPGVNPWEVFGLVVAGLIVVGLATPWTARLVIRRRRWRRRRPANGKPDRPDIERADIERADIERADIERADIEWAHAAWLELRDDLVDYGAGCLPSESPRAVATRAGTQLALAEPARAALGRIALAEERATYSARPADGSRLRQDSATVRRAIAVAAPRGIRWRGRLLPASVTGPALNAMAQAADIFGRLTPEWLGRFGTRTPLQAAFLSPAPALIEPLHHRGTGGLATAAPAAVTRTARAALADRTGRRRPAQRDGGHLPPAAQRPDAGQEQDDEPADRQADEMRQYNPGRDHRRAKNQPNERRYHPTPVMHVGIAGAN
jgi:transglutaminase-like putative cysteine protease